MNIYKYIFLNILLTTLLFLNGCGSLKILEESPYLYSPQYNSETNRFNNSNGESNNKSFFEFLTFAYNFFTRPFDEIEEIGFPILDPFTQKDSLSGRQIVWIGQSTLLLTIDGVTILTDPVFSMRASPFTFIGPKRVTPPAMKVPDLPKIDAVVISHNHYDHLDIESLKQINRLQPNIRYFVPLGIKQILLENGLKFVHELDWWENLTFNELTFTATPVNHWSSRSINDRNKTLWSGWMIEWPKYRFYFAGDTGYSNDFITTRNRLGSPDLAAIPIGAYEPRSFMKKSHVNPEESVRIFEDLSAKLAVAIHWGTFKLTTELLEEPPERLRNELKKKKINPSKFLSLKHGQKLHL
ncbi:MAG: Zn-dependent hydrolase [Betaproteobacteria bacterium TMED41]|nr:MAG: Zn-dependent hydrolase [Betaproteobacteria bacterium TMED41]